jgi:AcrR family transcriptional regulator
MPGHRTQASPQATHRADTTRQRILAIARDLFTRQGYTGTTNADIARRLGTTTAALYYHFSSKADILDSLLAEPLAAYAKLTDDATTGNMPPRELLAAYIDFTAATGELIPVLGADPAVRSVLDKRLPRRPEEMSSAIIGALMGPQLGRAAAIRAHAALAVAKEATLAVLPAGSGRLAHHDRSEILAAALRALSKDPAPQT